MTGKWKEQEKEYMRRWREAHPNYQKDRYEKNKERERAKGRKYRKEHKERQEETTRSWKKENPDRIKLHLLARRKVTAAIKAKVLTHYGNGKLACVRCGESRMACLSIDHVNGSGFKHRRKLGIGSGKPFYLWLKKNDYPIGYQTLCMNCQFVKRVENNEGCHGTT